MLTMTTPTEFNNWWIDDERTGKRQRTTYMLSRANAAKAFPAADLTYGRSRCAIWRMFARGRLKADPGGNPGAISVHFDAVALFGRTRGRNSSNGSTRRSRACQWTGSS